MYFIRSEHFKAIAVPCSISKDTEAPFPSSDLATGAVMNIDSKVIAYADIIGVKYRDSEVAETAAITRSRQRIGESSLNTMLILNFLTAGSSY